MADLNRPWRFSAVSRYPSNTSQGDLSDARSRRIVFDLYKPGVLTFAITGRSPQLDWLQELRSDVIAYRWNVAQAAFVPMFRGVINRSEDQISPTVHTVTMTATDYRAVLGRQVLRAPQTYTATEQGALVASLVTLGSTPAGYGGSLGLTSAMVAPDGSPIAATGVNRDRAYLRGQVIQSAIDDVATDISGFDFSVEPDPNNTGTTGVARVWYPQRGTARTVWVAQYGSTVTDVARVVSTDVYASYALTIGNAGGLFAESFGAGFSDPAHHTEGSWMSVQSQSDVSVQATLQQNSDGMIALYGALIPTYTLTLAAGRWTPADAWLGDTVRLIVNSGRLAVDTSARITGVDITIDDNGRETAALTVGLPPPTAGILMRQIDRRLSRLKGAVKGMR